MKSMGLKSVLIVVLQYGTFVVLVLAFQNCSSDRFAASSSAKNSNAQTQGAGGPLGPSTPGLGNLPGCHSFISVTVPLKIIIDVDNTGSTSGTDPNQAFRQSQIRAFLSSVQGKTNFSYNFQYFADVRLVSPTVGGGNFPLAISLINNGNNQDPTFGDPAALISALDAYQNILPNGYTNYDAALNLVQKAIEDDPDFQSNPNNQNYAIIFMSDGQPTDMYGNAVTDLTPFYQDVKDIVNLSPGHIALSTIYFNFSTSSSYADPGAIPLLQQMAADGHGQFGNTLVNPTLKLSDTITLPSDICEASN